MQHRAFFKNLWKEWGTDRITDVAAMMTYYAIFALFPMLVFVVTVALLVVPPEWLDNAVLSASAAMPGEVSKMISEQVAMMQKTAAAGFAIGGAALALWSASRGAASLSTALNDIFEKKETRPWWKRQLIAIGITLLVSVLLIVAMALLAAGPMVGEWLGERYELGALFDVAWTAARFIGAAVLVMTVWALLYKFLPDTDAPFRVFTPGAVVGVVLWFLVTKAFGLYLEGFASYEKTYGAVASVIIFLTWLWLSNIALLLGAEVNDILASMRAHKSPAAAELAREEKPSNVKDVKPEHDGHSGPHPAPAR